MTQDNVPDANVACSASPLARVDTVTPSARGAVPSDATTTMHATTIAQNGAGLLITGRSGSGKSALALQCIGLGARLVADDRTALRLQAGTLTARAPASIAGLLEVRGLGLMRLSPVADVPLRAVVDLDTVETERLPPYRETRIMGIALPLFRRMEGAHVASALLLCLAGAREVPAAPDAPAR
ncbi:MAG: serine kinase [Pseudomonadota bacterium]